MSIEKFLKNYKGSYSHVVSLRPDASSRQYSRMHTQKESFVVSHTPDSKVYHQFVKLNKFFADHGIAVPCIFYQNPEQGILIKEDFGDMSLGDMVRGNHCHLEKAYKCAVDVLLKMVRLPHENLNLIRYENETLFDQLSPFIHYFMDTKSKSFESFHQICFDLFNQPHAPYALTHRDFQGENIFWFSGEKGNDYCGIIDFQDAVICPLTYDLVSLLKDVRLPFNREREQKMLAYYLGHFPHLDHDVFYQSYEIMGVLRNLRIVGIFKDLAKNGKPDYLDFLPQAWSFIHDALKHESLEPLRHWLYTHISPDQMNLKEEVC